MTARDNHIGSVRKQLVCCVYDAPGILLRTSVAQLATTTNICPQGRQNGAATERATNVASAFK